MRGKTQARKGISGRRVENVIAWGEQDEDHRPTKTNRGKQAHPGEEEKRGSNIGAPLYNWSKGGWVKGRRIHKKSKEGFRE